MGRIADVLAGREAPSAAEALATELASQDYDLLDALVRIREASGITQQQLAEMIGVSQQAISKFEQIDSDPRLSTIRRYAIAVGAIIKHDVKALSSDSVSR